ncbi:hypothetical protein ACXHXG_29770 [Rhizobium sp. LEGMi198b]|uniref:hypothetical protein n=1 Tax=unclassified Rhizobium TaxID=2613769 RepID=UPI000CF21B48|nr:MULTISPECIES: hypothetical protein [Rhizobium]MDK4737290.1 hypothetical protein [Rhizobium sp. CNPSo 3464]UWU22439.1 hypothetical protein N2601_05595 [Rhizobium tropici]
MMSRYMQYGTAADPLQRPRTAALGGAKRPTPSHALLNGLRAIAPRLAFVFFAAAIIQMLVHWAGN